MTLVFLCILTIAWIVIFFPKALRVRRTHPLPAAELFKRRLELLAPKPSERGRWVMVPEPPSRARRRALLRARRRKKNLLVALMIAAATTFVAAIAWGSLWPVHLGVLSALIAYVVFLIGSRRLQQETREKIKTLSSARMEVSNDHEAVEERMGGGRL